MLDGRMLGASQAEYKPFGKPPLQRESEQLLAQEAERRSYRFSFQCKTLFEAQVEHLIVWLEIVDEEEAVGLPSRLLVDPVQLVLRQQAGTA